MPGVFVQDDFSIAPWLSVSASARADFHNQYGVFLSPRVSALLRWAGFTTPAVGRAGILRADAADRGNGGRRTVAAVAPVSAGGRARAQRVDRLDAKSRFALRHDDALRLQYQPSGLCRSGRRLSHHQPAGAPTRNRGAELLATWRKAPFSATASYTYVRSSELDPAAGRAEVPLTPRHSFGLVGMWEKEGVARFGVECYYTGQQRLEYNPYRAFSSPYVIFGAMGERKVAAHVKLFLNLENLGNVRQSRWDPLLLPSRAVDGRWTVDAWAPLDGRVINGGVRFMF